MIINNSNNKSFSTEYGKFTVGDNVIVKSGPYAGLIGTILEIRTGDDKETENPSEDIYCSFKIPKSEIDIKILEDRFSNLYGTKKTIDDIALDIVIMAPEELEVVNIYE